MGTVRENLIDEVVQTKNGPVRAQKVFSESHDSMIISSNWNSVRVSELNDSGRENGLAVTFKDYSEPGVNVGLYMMNILFFEDGKENGLSYAFNSDGGLRYVGRWENGEKIEGYNEEDEGFRDFASRFASPSILKSLRKKATEMMEGVKEADKVLGRCLTEKDPEKVKKMLAVRKAPGNQASVVGNVVSSVRNFIRKGIVH